MAQYDSFKGAGSGSGSGSGSMSVANMASHDDVYHTGNAKRKTASGLASLNASGVPEDSASNAVELQANKNAANGYPGLSAGSKIATSQLDTGTGANQLVQLDGTGKIAKSLLDATTAYPIGDGAAITNTGAMRLMHSATYTTTSTIAVQVGTKTFNAGDFAANDMILIEVVASGAVTNNGYGIGVAGGATLDANASSNICGIGQIKIAQDPTTNTKAVVFIFGLDETAPFSGAVKGNPTGLAANWITGAFTLSFRGWAYGGGTETSVWKVYKLLYA